MVGLPATLVKIGILCTCWVFFFIIQIAFTNTVATRYDVHAEDVAAVAATALQRGAGLVHIRNTVMDSPYNHLPDDAYMQSLFNAVSGGKVLLADPVSNKTLCSLS
jgi:hypothetical protein